MVTDEGLIYSLIFSLIFRTTLCSIVSNSSLKSSSIVFIWMATDEQTLCLLVILFFTCCFPHRTVLCASMMRQGKVTWVWLERCCQRGPAWTPKPKWGSIPWFQLRSFFILLTYLLETIKTISTHVISSHPNLFQQKESVYIRKQYNSHRIGLGHRQPNQPPTAVS